MYILVIFGSCPNPKVPSPFFMNMCSTPTMSPSPPSPPLNPLAKSWIPEAKYNKKILPAKKSAIMYPHDIFSSTSTSPPCSPVVTLWPTSAINQPFQQLHLLPQSLSTTPYNFHDPTVYYYGVCYSNEAYWCNNPGCLQPQPYQQAVLPLFAPTVPHISWSCADDLKEEVGENSTEKKRDSRICYRKKGWKTKTRFVPPRFERSQNMLHQGSENTLRQEWKAKKTKSGHGVVSAGAALVSPSIPPTESPIFQHGRKTTVMIRNIPNQYRYTFLL